MSAAAANPYLDDNLVMLGEHVRRFATQRVAPGFRARETTRTLDRALMREMGALGFIAPELPEADGGQGLSYVASGVIVEELARADLSIAYIQLLASLNGQILAAHGRPGVARPWLQRLTRGEALLALALTESRGGSDAASLRLRMERVGSEYVLNGEKTSISAADQADAAVVFARSGSVEAGARGVSAVLVPLDAPGITRTRFDCHGQRAIGRGSLFFEDVRVPADHLLGEEGGGFVQVMQGFDFSRALIGLQVLGVARVSLEETWAYVGAAPGLRPALVCVPGRLASARRLRDAGRSRAPALSADALAEGPRRAAHYGSRDVQVVGAAARVRHGARLPADARPRRLRPRPAVRAAPARCSGLPDRRRHRADHEDHHRPPARGTRGRSGLNSSKTRSAPWNFAPY